MKLRMRLVLLLLAVCSYPSLCQKSFGNASLIPTDEEHGGVDKTISEEHANVILDGPYKFARRTLTNIKINHDGTVEFNNGSLSIAVFNTNLTDSDYYAHFIYDHKTVTDTEHFENQTQYVTGLLDAESFDDYNVTDMFVITWRNYRYCESYNITFQLAIASTSSATYALFLYDGEEECNITVKTGFKTDYYNKYEKPLIPEGENVQKLWQPNNVFIYEIHDIELRCTNLIPAREDAGGIDYVFNMPLLNHELQGQYNYSDHSLTTISIYHDGSVQFNNGALSIAVFLTNLTDGHDTYFIYDYSSGHINASYIEDQRQMITSLLNAAAVSDSIVTDFFLITWKNYTYCQSSTVTFQLAVASTSTATYALFLYCGNNCNEETQVKTGLKTDEVCGYQHQTLVSEDVESLWQSSNIGIPGVFLYEISTISTKPPCIRLVDNKTDVNGINGTVEVYHNGEWRSVCDDYWTDVEADVACGQLGYLPYGAEALNVTGTTRDYWLDDVNCRGSESSIFDCTYKMIGNCHQRKRAAVRCKRRGEHIDIRHNSTSGIIELKYNNEWRPVSASFWSQEDARVACKELGLPYSGAMAMSEDEKETGEKSKFWMDYVHCTGDEDSLFACRHMGVGTVHEGTHKKIAAVYCI